MACDDMEQRQYVKKPSLCGLSSNVDRLDGDMDIRVEQVTIDELCKDIAETASLESCVEHVRGALDVSQVSVFENILIIIFVNDYPCP